MTARFVKLPVLGVMAALLVAAGFAENAAAQAQAQAQPRTNSGVLKRVPLDQWMPERCPEPEQRGEVVVCGRPEEPPRVEAPPPVPGDPATDVPARRKELTEMGNTTPGSCTARGPGGAAGCVNEQYEQWRRERELQKAREKVPEPQ
jgi:hypothetical protein